MKPFPITCVTCNARLLVRNPALIGQILACPRCGSMVHVAEPAPLAPTQANSHEPPSAIPKAPTSGALSNSSAPPHLADAPKSATPDTAFDPDWNASDVQDVAGTDAALDSVDHAPLDTLAAESPLHWVAWSGVGVLLGIAVVGGSLTWLRSGGASDEASNSNASHTMGESEGVRHAVAKPPLPDDLTAEAALPPMVQVEGAGTGDLNADNPTPDATTSDVPPTPLLAPRSSDATSQPEESQPGEAMALNPTPDLPELPEAVENFDVEGRGGDDSSSAQLARAETTDTSASGGSGGPGLTIDPLDLDPEGLNMSTLLSSAASHSRWRDEEASESAAESMSEEQDAPPPEPLAPDVPTDAVSEGPSLVDAPVTLDPLGAPAGTTSDVKTQIEQPLAAVHIDAMPWPQLVSLLQRLAGVPLSVEPSEVRYAGVDFRRPISVKLEETTVAALAQSAFKPLRLEPSATATQWVLRREGLTDEREIVYPIDDLTTGATTAEALASLIRQFVEPASW
ncbi:MAG: hypothetical protein KDA61_08845, partial [Planctomycetales bacterium]|nr:hypothetical protein [Planctomycetales bacterium]